MERLTRRFGHLTLAFLGIAVVSGPFSLIVAIPSGILFTAGVVCWMFTAFRLSHLREIEHYPRR